MKGERFKQAAQTASTAIAISRETRDYLRCEAKEGEAVDDTLRRLLVLPPRDRATLRLGPPDDTQ
jgi:hypothetical protein